MKFASSEGDFIRFAFSQQKRGDGFTPSPSWQKNRLLLRLSAGQPPAVLPNRLPAITPEAQIRAHMHRTVQRTIHHCAFPEGKDPLVPEAPHVPRAGQGWGWHGLGKRFELSRRIRRSHFCGGCESRMNVAVRGPRAL